MTFCRENTGGVKHAVIDAETGIARPQAHNKWELRARKAREKARKGMSRQRVTEIIAGRCGSSRQVLARSIVGVSAVSDKGCGETNLAGPSWGFETNGSVYWVQKVLITSFFRPLHTWAVFRNEHLQQIGA